MNVIPFPKHKFHRCSEFDCYTCDGGLAFCDVCKGAEVSLPTDCPGAPMQEELQDAVQAGTLDYTRKDGWTGSMTWTKGSLFFGVDFGKPR